MQREMETKRERSVLLLVCLFFLQLAVPRCKGVVLPPPRPGPALVSLPGCTGDLPVNGPRSNDSVPITITAFFPLPNGEDETPPPAAALHYLLPAAVIALEEVNRAVEKEGLFPYHLQLDVRNSSCDRFIAVHELILSLEENIKNRTPHLAVLGPGCLDVTRAVSPLSHRLFLPQVTYANETNVPVVTPDEKSEEFPDLFLVVRNVLHIAKTALRVMDHFQWTEQVAFLYDDLPVYVKTVELLVKNSDGHFTLAVGSRIRINVPAGALEGIPSDERNERVHEFMRTVRSKKIRVIAGLVGVETACGVLCEAKNGVIPGEGFVFVFVGTFQENWWQTCLCGLEGADVESLITVSSQVKVKNGSDDEFELGSNLTHLKQDYISRLNKWCPETNGTAPNTFFATTYDSLLALGLAIKSSLPTLNASAENSNRTILPNDSPVYQEILNSLAESNFTGASGRVTFSDAGERMGVDFIQQIQSGKVVLVGTYQSESKELDIDNGKVRWPGGEVPGVFPSDDPKTATLIIIVTVLIVTIASNIVAVVLLILVIRHRNHRIFLASGQRLNYIVFTGIFSAYVTLYIFVLLESDLGPRLPAALFSALCIIRLYLITLSFTFTFGTLFARAWRIYRIFNNPFVTSRRYTDTHLMLIVAVLGIVDVVILTVYVAVDKYGRFVDRAEADYDTFAACTYLGCRSGDQFVIFSGIVAAYKVMQMLLFTFVVSLVRRGVIERKIYDDSKFLAMVLYVTAIVFLIGFPLQVLLSISFKIAESLAVNMVWVIVSADITMGAIYVPKLYQIIYKKVDVRKLMTQKTKFYLYSETRSTIL